MFAFKKIFLKNFIFLVQSIIKKAATIIMKILKIVSSIFYTPILMSCIVKSSFFVKVRCIILTLLFKLNKTNTRSDNDLA